MNDEFYKPTNIELIEETLTDLIHMGKIQVEELNELQSEMEGDPKFVKMWTECAKNVSDLTSKLMQLEKMKNPVVKGKSKVSVIEDDRPQTVNNNLFVGSGSDILRIFEKQKGIISTHDLNGDDDNG